MLNIDHTPVTGFGNMSVTLSTTYEPDGTIQTTDETTGAWVSGSSQTGSTILDPSYLVVETVCGLVINAFQSANIRRLPWAITEAVMETRLASDPTITTQIVEHVIRDYEGDYTEPDVLYRESMGDGNWHWILDGGTTSNATDDLHLFVFGIDMDGTLHALSAAELGRDYSDNLVKVTDATLIYQLIESKKWDFMAFHIGLVPAIVSIGGTPDWSNLISALRDATTSVEISQVEGGGGALFPEGTITVKRVTWAGGPVGTTKKAATAQTWLTNRPQYSLTIPR
jgi:hypothetical protein